MGGKTSTSTSGVSIPPSVLAQYNSVVAGANQTAQTPFSTYGGSFVAPVNSTQTQGINATTAAANEAQPYNQAAAVGTIENAAPVSGADINQYLSPYLGDVLGSTEALQNQSNEQQQAGQLGDAITSGAFGSDRTGIAAANLEEQQNLANNSTIANIANTGYTTALGEANTEQQAGLAGASQLSNIGNAAQASSLSGASAELAAGTVQQQTQQAEDTALYNQFEQQQSYPFQVGSWLAGISEGTGSLEGSTTTTTQPGGFFSDRRLKRDIKKIGKTYDGQDVVTYKMGDDDRTRIGLIAQDVEKRHPEAVGVAGGYKTVDYGKATKEAANEGHFYTGGVVAFPRKNYAVGGVPDGLAGVLQAQQAMYSQMGGGQAGLSGSPRVPAASSSGHGVAVANTGGVRAPQTGMQNVQQAAALAKTGDGLYNDFTKPSSDSNDGINTNMDTNGVDATVSGFNAAQPSSGDMLDSAMATDSGAGDGMKRGGIAGRRGFDSGGSPYSDDGGIDIPDDQNQNKLAVAATAPASQSSGTQDMNDIASIASIAEAAKRGGAIFRQKRDAGGQTLTVAGQPQDANQGGGNTLAVAAPLAEGPAQEENSADMNDIMDIVKIAGLIAMAKRGGRIKGYADGGDPTDDDSDPEDVGTAVTADPTPAPTGVAAAQPSLWDKVKSVATSPGVLATLEGLGAMGTARTVHPGVALAAGLEAAAGAYPGIQQGLAGAQQTQAQTRGIDIQNQIAAMKAKAASDYLNPTGGVVPPTQAPTQGAPQAAASAPSAAQAAVAAAPQSGAAQAPIPTDPASIAASIDQQYRQKYFVQPGYTPDEQAKMQQALRASMVLGDAPVKTVQQAHDNRVQTKQAANQNAAQAEADSLYAQVTDPTVPQATQQAALIKYNALRQWTGDGTELSGGIVRNTRTKQPEIGTIAQQALTPEQTAQLGLESWSVVTDANGNQWRVNKSTGQRLPVQGARAGTTPPASAPNVATSDTSGNYLPGIDFTKLPQTTPQSGFATNTSQITPQKTEDFRTAQLSDANDAATQDAKTRSIVAAAQNELTKVPARLVGPGSPLVKNFEGLRTAVTGSAPDALVDEGELDKYLNQLGAQNVRSLLSGQRITNQEMSTFMTRGSPNVAQPLRTVQNLVNYLSADTDYDSKLQATKIKALESGADPWALPGAIDATPGADRASYVQSKLGFTPGFAPRQRPGQSTAPDSSGYIVGKMYRNAKGQTAVYQGNGQWQ